MNIVLLTPGQQCGPNDYRLTQRQCEHLAVVLKVTAGAVLRVGLLNGGIGEGVLSGEPVSHIHVLEWPDTPPAPLPLTLILALPRPSMLKRTLLNITMMGVKEIIIVHSAKVEKSYWQSPVLQPHNLDAILLEGLEQAKDTIMPRLQMQTRFRRFVEDELPSQMQGKRCLLAHPYQAIECPVALSEDSILAIGPEGGWTPYEVDKWQAIGFETVHLGPRILKVETAVPVLLSRLYPAM